MLQQNCIVAKGTTGLNPDTTDYNNEKAVKKWLTGHLEVKPRSKEEEIKVAERMKELRMAIKKDRWGNIPKFK